MNAEILGQHSFSLQLVEIFLVILLSIRYNKEENTWIFLWMERQNFQLTESKRKVLSPLSLGILVLCL